MNSDPCSTPTSASARVNKQPIYWKAVAVLAANALPRAPAKNEGSACYLATLLYYRLRRIVLWLIMFQVKPANLNEVHD